MWNRQAIEAGIDLAVPSLRHLRAIARAAVAAGQRGRVHLHLDVGMARDGADPAEWPRLCGAAFRGGVCTRLAEPACARRYAIWPRRRRRQRP